MKTAHLRTEVESLIKRADERLLEMVYALAVSYDKGEIVGYTTAGRPLTAEAYRDEMEEAMQDIGEGRTISTEDLKERASTWKGKYSR